MTGLLRRGEESGGYDRRRVQIITIIIFPGNMAAERGWPPGIRVGGKREGERENEGRREEGSQAQAGRVIIILQTTAAGTYLYNPSPSFVFELSSRSFLPPLVLPSFHPLFPLSGSSSWRFAYTVPKFPARNSHERSHPAIVALYTPNPSHVLLASLPSLPPPPPPPPPPLPPPLPPPCPLSAYPTASGSSSSFSLTLYLGLRCVLRVYDPIENVHPRPRHDLALVSTPNGSRRSTRILA